MEDAFSNLAGLQIPPAQLQTCVAAVLHPPRTLPVRAKSIGGPILVGWLVAAAKQGRCALLLGLMVWCARNWAKGGRELVALSGEAFAAWGIARPDRALSGLEASSLIEIVSRHDEHVEVVMLVPEALHGQFILGPLDVSWILRASQLGIKALLCGLALWWLHGRRRRRNDYERKAVSNLALDVWGISPDAKLRALRKLANAGLIEVEYRQKRSPRVTILSPYAKDRAKAPASTRSGEVAA